MTYGIKKLTSWSFSRWSVYDQCPAKAKYKFIDKLKEPDALPLQRGSIIHKQAECFIKGLPCPVLDESKPIPKLGPDGEFVAGSEVKYHKVGVLPPELAAFAVYFAWLRNRYKNKLSAMAVEDSWAFRAAWDKTVFNDWNGCVCRVKVDCAYEEKGILYIDDWKTGKYNPDLAEEYKKALQLYSLAGFMWYPTVKKIRPRLRYLDMNVSWPEEDGELEYARADVPKLKKLWADRTRPLLNDTIFAPKPNAKCKWCPYSSKFVDRNTGKLVPGPCAF